LHRNPRKCKIQKAIFLLAAGKCHKDVCKITEKSGNIRLGVFPVYELATFSKASEHVLNTGII